MKYIAYITTHEFITLTRHGFLSGVNVIKVSESNIPVALENMILNGKPFRYEFDGLALIVNKQGNEIFFEDVISIHPLTNEACDKFEVDFPNYAFDSPLTSKLDLDLYFIENRSIEIERSYQFLSRIFLNNLVSPKLNLSRVQVERSANQVNPNKRPMLETALLFNESDNYPNHDIKYFMRLGEIVILHLYKEAKNPGGAFKKTEAYKDWAEVANSNREATLNLLNKLVLMSERFVSTIKTCDDAKKIDYLEVIPLFLKSKELLQEGKYDQLIKSLISVDSELSLSYVLYMLSSLFNFNQFTSLTKIGKSYEKDILDASNRRNSNKVIRDAIDTNIGDELNSDINKLGKVAVVESNLIENNVADKESESIDSNIVVETIQEEEKGIVEGKEIDSVMGDANIDASDELEDDIEIIAKSVYDSQAAEELSITTSKIKKPEQSSDVALEVNSEKSSDSEYQVEDISNDIEEQQNVGQASLFGHDEKGIKIEGMSKEIEDMEVDRKELDEKEAVKKKGGSKKNSKNKSKKK